MRCRVTTPGPGPADSTTEDFDGATGMVDEDGGLMIVAWPDQDVLEVIDPDGWTSVLNENGD